MDYKVSNLENKSIFDLIENDYLDFEFQDIEIKKLFSKLKQFKLSNDDIIKIKELYEKKIFPQIHNSLSSIQSPYLINILKYYIDQFSNDDIKQKFLFLILLNNREDISKELENFFFQLIKINRLGISNSIKSIFTKEVMASKEYELFLKKLSIWHSHIEFIIFYIDYLLTYYKKTFIFNKSIFEIENNKGSYTGILLKKSLFKLSSTLCSHLHLDPKIDYKKLILFIALSLQSGFSWTTLLKFFPKSHLSSIATSLSLNFLIGKLSSKLEYESLFVEFRKISENIEKLNMNLFKIENYLFQLIELEIKNDLNEKLGKETSQLKESIKKLSEKIEFALKNIDFDEEFAKKVEEEYVNLSSQITMEEIENSYVVVNVGENNI